MPGVVRHVLRFIVAVVAATCLTVGSVIFLWKDAASGSESEQPRPLSVRVGKLLPLRPLDSAGLRLVVFGVPPQSR